MALRVAVVFGTRPEAIKLSPIIMAPRVEKDVELTVISTGQHREMLRQATRWFGIDIDYDLDLMEPNQSISDFFAKAVSSLDALFRNGNYSCVIVQGDTTTAFAGAISGFYNRIPVAHVEAGLRTYDRMSPWPEEVNRNLISRLASFHFAPTVRGKSNLLREGIPEPSIHVTGNTAIDALLYSSVAVAANPRFPEALRMLFVDSQSQERVVLVTGHRRENFGEGLALICKAVRSLAESNPDVHFVYPVHLNPNVKDPVMRSLSGLRNVHLTEPLDYPEFITLMIRSHIILSDSGGVQEEAPSLGKPVLVLRENTERPEAIEAGTAKLVGTDYNAIVTSVQSLLDCPSEYDKMAKIANPFGNGDSARRILEVLIHELQN